MPFPDIPDGVVKLGVAVLPGTAMPQVRNWKVGEYKPPPSMRRTLDRAHADQPPLMTMTGSAANDKPDWWPK